MLLIRISRNIIPVKVHWNKLGIKKFININSIKKTIWHFKCLYFQFLLLLFLLLLLFFCIRQIFDLYVSHSIISLFLSLSLWNARQECLAKNCSLIKFQREIFVFVPVQCRAQKLGPGILLRLYNFLNAFSPSLF